MHAFWPCSSLPPRSTLDSARYAPIASTPHLSHNCGQICDRNCDINCDANVGPDQLHDMIHFRIRSTFSVHGHAQDHTKYSLFLKRSFFVDALAYLAKTARLAMPCARSFIPHSIVRLWVPLLISFAKTARLAMPCARLSLATVCVHAVLLPYASPICS